MSEMPSTIARRRWRPGPGLLVTAAFIGPGTVTTASRAGAQYGLALLWTLVLAVLATIILQEMAARLGLVARQGLAEAIRQSISHPAIRGAALLLVIAAIVLGNTAYQTGNLIGAGMGLSVLTGLPTQWCGVAIGLVVAVLLALGGASHGLQRALIMVVLAMSAAFLMAGCLAKVDPLDAARAATTFRLPPGSWLTALALVGTTVVPYNLFLHASAVKERWRDDGKIGDQLRFIRLDAILAITLGGLVTMAIVVTAAGVFHTQGQLPTDAGDLARQLKPLLGSAGQWLFAGGLVAAGLTSAITAPLAAGYVAAGALPHGSQATGKATAIVVALAGVLLAATLGASPQQAIVAAQAANGLLLPLVAGFLLWVMNRADLLGPYRNGWLLNLAGGGVVLLALALGLKGLWALTA